MNIPADSLKTRRAWPFLKWFRRNFSWIIHPITIFVTLQIVWLATLLIWVIWFVAEGESISQLAKQFGGQYFDEKLVLLIMIIGCVLLGVLLVGTIILFVFGQKQTSLARRQRSFVSSVTHELKSPLSSLQLTFETLMAHKVDEDTRQRMMDMVLTDIARLKRLVDQILVAGRLDKGIVSYQDDIEHVNLNLVLRDVCSKLSYMDAQFEDRLKIKCDENILIPSSRDALMLILSNLVENAVKYSDLGSPIKIVAAQESNALIISISDEGIGLDKKEQRRIFRMFHRAETSTKKAIPGTGLGLFIVKSAAKALGGKVWAESSGRDRGTTFFVSLPLLEVVFD